MSPGPDDPIDQHLRRRWRERLRPWQPEVLREKPGIIDPLTGEVYTQDDFIPTPKIPPQGFERFPKPGSAWLPNMGCIIMIIASLVNWTWTKGMPPFVATGERVFQDGEWWRVVFALFGHGDVMHIAHNAPVFWFFAWVLHAYFGWVASIALTLAIGLLSNLWTLWIYDPEIQLLGASGMIYGMVALWLVLYIRFDTKGWWVKRVMRSLGFSLLVLFPQTYERNVSYLAHATGFGLGIAVGLLWLPWARRYAPVFTDPYYKETVEIS